MNDIIRAQTNGCFFHYFGHLKHPPLEVFNLGKNRQKGPANSGQYQNLERPEKCEFFSEDEGESVNLVKFLRTL